MKTSLIWWAVLFVVATIVLYQLTGNEDEDPEPDWTGQIGTGQEVTITMADFGSTASNESQTVVKPLETSGEPIPCDKSKEMQVGVKIWGGFGNGQAPYNKLFGRAKCAGKTAPENQIDNNATGKAKLSRPKDQVEGVAVCEAEYKAAPKKPRSKTKVVCVFNI